MPNQFQESSDHYDRFISAKVQASVLIYLPGLVHPGKGLVTHNYPGICFIILKKYIIARPVLFYQVVFEKQGIFFRTNNNMLNISDPFNQDPGLAIFRNSIKVR